MIAEVLLGALRLAHALAAAMWLGGALAYAVGAAPPPGRPGVWLRDLLRPAIGVFVVTGTIMAADRLASAPLPPWYFGLLGMKVALGVWMFTLARGLGSPRQPQVAWITGARGILLLGVVVYALALTLRSIYEATLRQATWIAG